MTAKVLDILPKRRGAAQPRDGRQVFDLYPDHRSGRHFLYAVGFHGGVVKVGRTHNPRARLKAHWSKVDGEVEWAHVFEGGSDRYARLAEHRALEALKKVAKQINRSEWFRFDDKATVLNVVRGVIRDAKETAAKWDAESRAAAIRHAKAQQLLAEHEAALAVANRVEAA